MGWANCGADSKGRPIGYAHSATCDYEGCKKRIDRGLDYACGGMHGAITGETCEGYFCGDHRVSRYVPGEQRHVMVCQSCAVSLDRAKEADLLSTIVEVAGGGEAVALIRHALQWDDEDMIESFVDEIEPDNAVWLALEPYEQTAVQVYRQRRASFQAHNAEAA